MSISIKNDGIAAPATALPAPVENAAPAAKSTSAGASGSGAAAGDHVEISSLSGNIADSSQALAGQETSRVAQLAALYSKGEYHVDSAQLSRALVASALSGSLSGGSLGGEN